MCVCAYVCVCMCVYACVCACACVCVYACVCACACVCVCMCVSVCAYACVCVCACVVQMRVSVYWAYYLIGQWVYSTSPPTGSHTRSITRSIFRAKVGRENVQKSSCPLPLPVQRVCRHNRVQTDKICQSVSNLGLVTLSHPIHFGGYVTVHDKSGIMHKNAIFAAS